MQINGTLKYTVKSESFQQLFINALSMTSSILSHTGLADLNRGDLNH